MNELILKLFEIFKLNEPQEGIDAIGSEPHSFFDLGENFVFRHENDFIYFWFLQFKVFNVVDVKQDAKDIPPYSVSGIFVLDAI